MTAAQFRLCASRINPAFRVETGAVAEAYHALLRAADMAEEIEVRSACAVDSRGGTMDAAGKVLTHPPAATQGPEKEARSDA